MPYIYDTPNSLFINTGCWGDKVLSYARTWEDDSGDNTWYQVLMFLLDPGFNINPCAFLVSLGAVLLLLDGVKESKMATNFFSTLNVSLVLFMATMRYVNGLVKHKFTLSPLIKEQLTLSYAISLFCMQSLILAKSENMTPLIPPQFGVGKSQTR